MLATGRNERRTKTPSVGKHLALLLHPQGWWRRLDSNQRPLVVIWWRLPGLTTTVPPNNVRALYQLSYVRQRSQHRMPSSGAYLLFQSETTSTIGAKRLNFRVRNENGCDPLAKAPELGIRCIEICKGCSSTDCYIQDSARETGHISTPRLHTLRCFHLEPINVVISHESHNDS